MMHHQTETTSAAVARICGVFTVAVSILIGCTTAAHRPTGSGQPTTAVYLSEVNTDQGQRQVIILTLFEDGNGFLVVKNLGLPPAAGRIYQGNWEWRADPRRVELTPDRERPPSPIVFMDTEQGLMYVGERLGKRPILLTVDP